MTRGQGCRQQRVKKMINMAVQHFGNMMEWVGELQYGDSFLYTETFDTDDDAWHREDDGHDEVDVVNYFGGNFANLCAVHVDEGSGDDEQEEEDVVNGETGELEDDDVVGYFATINSGESDINNTDKDDEDNNNINNNADTDVDDGGDYGSSGAARSEGVSINNNYNNNNNNNNNNNSNNDNNNTNNNNDNNNNNNNNDEEATRLQWVDRGEIGVVGRLAQAQVNNNNDKDGE
ncbi:hypothetical protein CBR_g26214 [Chara braunii]|uniref:Uncharacterized protein n=1 Tax=Chara braunii TaxID=69332 RepID=A0A388L783_CHABU|nr:hypothetical protein CBR_g26214 [Chara braunii]|eukprot:GBG78181.1 hypothetical protein CBR_g26214 [Chara braunii]